MVNAVHLGKKLNSGQSWLTSLGGVENVRSEKKKKAKFHNLEGIFILALYYPSIRFKMALKHEARIAPAPAVFQNGGGTMQVSD